MQNLPSALSAYIMVCSLSPLHSNANNLPTKYPIYVMKRFYSNEVILASYTYVIRFVNTCEDTMSMQEILQLYQQYGRKIVTFFLLDKFADDKQKVCTIFRPYFLPPSLHKPPKNQAIQTWRN